MELLIQPLISKIPTNEQTVTRPTVATEAGKTLTLFVYATDSNDNNRTVWSYTSEGIAVKSN